MQLVFLVSAILSSLTRSAALVAPSSQWKLRAAISPRSPLQRTPNVVTQPLSVLTRLSSQQKDDTLSWKRPVSFVSLSNSSPNAPTDTDAKKSAPPPIVNPDSKNRLVAGLAFLTGWADVSLVFKYKTFATMMTGNTMWMASAAIDSRFKDVGYYGSLIVCYILGLVGFRRSDMILKDKSLTMACAPAVVALFVGSDYLSFLNPAARWVPMMLLATAFGIVNSVGSEVGGTLAFVLTGHMTKMTNMFVDRLCRTTGRKKLKAADWASIKQSSIVIGAFFGGALWACGLLGKAPELLKRGNFSIMGLMYGMLFLWQDREKMGAWWLSKNDKMCDIDTYETTCV